MQIGRILLPFDGSPHSHHAAEYALVLAKRAKAQVTIVNCYDEGNWELSGISEFLIAGIKANRRKKAEEILDKAAMIFQDQQVDFHLETLAGLPGSVLPLQAKSKGYDLIIMGSHGHSNLEGLFLGSVTHKILNTIYCPILIVP